MKIGDGFIAKKTMKNDLVYGYTLIRLSDGKEIPFIIRDIYHNNNKKILYQLGPYLFYKDAFSYIYKVVNDWIKNDVNPIFLDEISILELQEKGYYEALKKLLICNKDLYLVVRSDLIKKVVKKFNIKEFQVVGG